MSAVTPVSPEVRHEMMRIAGEKVSGETGQTLDVMNPYTDSVVGTWTGSGAGTPGNAWVFDVTFKDGSRMRNHQVAARRWADGKVIYEQFFYQPNINSAG